jgi:hypothetical protein
LALKPPQIALDPEGTFCVDLSGVRLETREDIGAFFDSIDAWWRRRCRSKKVYFAVDYTNFGVNLRENDYYAERMKQTVALCAITVVRYGGDDLQRSAARIRGMKVHAASNLYGTREEALSVLRAIRAGQIAVTL